LQNKVEREGEFQLTDDDGGRGTVPYGHQIQFNDGRLQIYAPWEQNSIGCRYCGNAIDLTDPSTRAFIEEFASVMVRLYSSFEETVKTH